MLITIIIFIVILGILVFVHEFGHFIAAKKSGMVVEEFGFGFPPRFGGIYKLNGRFKWVWGSAKDDPNLQGMTEKPTVYSINWIPLGGFVKILGENNEHEYHPGSFINKGFWPRLITLVAGVVMNWLLAAVIFSSILFVGTISEIGPNMPKNAQISNRQVAISQVEKDSPAAKAGLKPEDFILSIDGKAYENVEDARAYIFANKGKVLEFEVKRFDQILKFSVSSLENYGPDSGPTGIAITNIAHVKLPLLTAIAAGFKQTYIVTKLIFSQLGGLFTSQEALSQVGGPVQIAKIVGQVRLLGIIPLLNLTALLSLSLAVLNILPFPALDGGRVAFLLVEKLRGKRNNQKIEQAVNTLGFMFLLLLMVVITAHDIFGK